MVQSSIFHSQIDKENIKVTEASPEGFNITTASPDHSKPQGLDFEVDPRHDRLSLTSYADDDLKLSHSWVLWYRERRFDAPRDFKKSLIEVSSVSTAHQFMGHYLTMKRPSDIKS